MTRFLMVALAFIIVSSVPGFFIGMLKGPTEDCPDKVARVFYLSHYTCAATHWMLLGVK